MTTIESLPSNLGDTKELARVIAGCKTLGFTRRETLNYVIDHTECGLKISDQALLKLIRQIYAG